jgi:hypothetical protein
MFARNLVSSVQSKIWDSQNADSCGGGFWLLTLFRGLLLLGGVILSDGARERHGWDRRTTSSASRKAAAAKATEGRASRLRIIRKAEILGFLLGGASESAQATRLNGCRNYKTEELVTLDTTSQAAFRGHQMRLSFFC